MLLSLQYVYTDVITENISKIFLKRNFDLNESRIILLSAQESFSILKEIQNVDDLKNHSGYLTKIGFLMLKIFNDLKQEDLEVLELFSHINEELKGKEILNLKIVKNKSGIKRKIIFRGRKVF